jgi:predicted nucleic acid-binding Zn ribbon protein
MDSLEKAFQEKLQQSYNISSLSSEVQKYLRELSQRQRSDLSPTDSYFSNETKEWLARESAQRLARALVLRGDGPVAMMDIQAEWQKIVVDFHRAKYWGQTTQKQKPPKILTEDQKRVRVMFPYLWIAFQALIVMKVVISYFGQEAADSGETPWFLYLAIAFSFGSLVLFAWRKSKKGE